ncbi:uncharacterized protein N0V89_009725 [Didymosphaeria variabile]|uniref:Mg-dependent DNase n=1 Tax=Didymosphaeria variabile TaxID=1932322 RepID=A0A9W8XFM3_9PLEO|nr:uncharacterized protein N0V89_009725 [Didymosphaeria variabile]KAJ4348351.1 hypothetical protein N0V89_009725 [Didymosphaeria variabile]
MIEYALRMKVLLERPEPQTESGAVAESELRCQDWHNDFQHQKSANMAADLLRNLPKDAPAKAKPELQYADVSVAPRSKSRAKALTIDQVAVTATAKEFAGIYRNKQYHAPDFPAVLDRASEANVKKVMLTGMSLSDAQFNADIARSRPDQCSITVGVHPYHAQEPYANGSDGSEYFSAMAKTIADLQAETPVLVSAFGELGLDYDHLEWASKDVQIRCFKDQLELLVKEKYDLPLFLHCRASFDDFVAVIEPYLAQLPRRGLVHSFVGSSTQMMKLTDMCFDVSVNGFSFKDRESLEMVAAVPLERLQLETDAPWGIIQPSSEAAKNYLLNAAPLPVSKKKDRFQTGMMVKERNESCAMSQVAFVVAGVKGLGVDEVAQAAWQNSTAMFRLDS